MQEMKKRRIVLASLLKPVNDPRMFEKMGVSLARSGHYEVHIIGYPSLILETEENVHFHPLTPFKRISFGRLARRLKALQIIIKVKPELLIVTTHELLGVAILIRILFGTKIIYDIQENYWRNILYTNTFPKLIRPLIAFFARLKEWVASPFFSRFFLAEKCYADELRFVKNKFIVLENKCKLPTGFQRKPNPDFTQVLFTGTLAESTGIFQAIDLIKKLHAVDPKVRLNIVGYCAQPSVLQKIKQEVSKNEFITLTGGDEFVAHGTIMDAIASANLGIIYYPRSPHTENKIPTKLFEYLACRLPVLLQDHKPWTELADQYNAAINVDFKHPEVEAIIAKNHSDSFYSKRPDGMSWETEEKKLLNLLSSIF
jgi:glycosyltransferase involved in cell wall biosynthesis